ncbi:MAG: molecular chaperone DnaJ [Chitinophagales bacterium]|jgi:molecular chaperone DnaJ|nr:molecular chaperone DnaJ [Chitinophagales bacterium]MBP9135824.1 molecular chaperone DnaJ [Chitinophagales bacterium]
MKRDYYEILGVSKNATADELKKAYRKIALQYHPDRNPGDKESEDKFKEAAEAYDVLSNEEKKAKYDRFGHQGMGQGGFGGGGFGGGMNMEDIFSNFGDVFGEGSPFESFFGGGRQSRRKTGKGETGSNIRIKVKLNLEEIANGVKKQIKVKKHISCDACSGSGAKDGGSFQTCQTCNGQGQVRRVTQTILGQMATASTCPTCSGEGRIITNKCTKCRGEGRMYGEEMISIDIPAGVTEGIQLSMNGKGNAGMRGGYAGDLLINIEEEKHAQLRREGQDIVFPLHLNFADAVLGTSVEIPTISGSAKIKIPKGTQSGKLFRLQGKGLPSINSYGKGDQIVEVQIFTPEHVSDEEIAMLEKMRTSKSFVPGQASDKNEKGFFGKFF